MPLEHLHEQAHPRQPKRSFVQYRLDRPGFITPIGHHLSTSVRYTCLIRSISSAGAVLSINRTLTLPENFYLEIRGGDEMVVRFNMFLDADFLKVVLGRPADLQDA
jgi:hypothetical protein